jgi:serine/threonine protein kinase
MLLIEEGKDYHIDNELELPYTLVRNLGHGHSGNVEQVKDDRTGAVFARKTFRIPHFRLRKTRGTDHHSEVKNVFDNEVKIIRALGNHHHIVSVFATYTTKREFALILQPVASEGDLAGFLDLYLNPNSEHGHPREDIMAGILERAFGCLSEGLSFMHKRAVRHKDIKPRNILVHNGIVLYTDFGYSFDSSPFGHGTTEGRPNFFTRRYCAPEVLMHDKRSFESDIFSLGCVFFEILSALCRTLFSDVGQILSDDIDSLHENLAVDDVPSELVFLSKTIIGMTARSPSQRPTANDLCCEILLKKEFGCEKCRHSRLAQVRDMADTNVDEANRSELERESTPDHRGQNTSTSWVQKLGIEAGRALLVASAVEGLHRLGTAPGRPSGSERQSTPHSSVPQSSSLPSTSVIDRSDDTSVDRNTLAVNLGPNKMQPTYTEKWNVEFQRYLRTYWDDAQKTSYRRSYDPSTGMSWYTLSLSLESG